VEENWRSNLEIGGGFGWGIWLGDEIIWFWGKQKKMVISKQAGGWCRQGPLHVLGLDQ
jgi:hypothetical protein